MGAPDQGVAGPDLCRRSVLRGTGLATVAVLAGCAARSGDETGCASRPDDPSGPVPAAYEGAESRAGLTREPSSLLTKAEGRYRDSPNGEQRCGRCSYYVPDRDGDCLGACVRIEGLIDPDGWCEYYRTQVGGGW